MALSRLVQVPSRMLTSLISVSVLLFSSVAVWAWAGNTPAVAAQATGGSARFGQVEWIQWGLHNTPISNGASRTSEVVIGAATLSVTCTISNHSGAALRAYQPGNWRGDGFDDLYNIGGTGASNTLHAGLANVADKGEAKFDFTCTPKLTRNGVVDPAFKLAGLVMADAESSAGAEVIAATATGATWRIIDRIRGASCTQEAYAHRFGDTLTLAGPAVKVNNRHCEDTDATSPQPSAIAFMEGATQARNVTVKGGGYSAIALGFMVDVDYGDAPAVYGDAAALIQPTYSGGTIANQSAPYSNPTSNTGRGTALFANFTRASAGPAALRLGDSVDAESASHPTTSARGDDDSGTTAGGGPDDEDGAVVPNRIVATPGGTVTQGVTCHATAAQNGKVKGWIDWNLNNAFDPNEGSSTELCTGSGQNVTLTWTVPTDVMGTYAGTQNSYLRVRIVDADETPLPTGLSAAGEVEDYAFNLTTPPRLTLTKEVGSRTAATDQFTVAASGGTLAPNDIRATTVGAASSVTTATGYLAPATTYTISDAIATGATGAMADYASSLVCRDARNGNSAVATVAAGTGQWTLSNLSYGQDVVCTISNNAKPAVLNVVKTAGTVSGPAADGTFEASYTVAVTNSGPSAGTYTLTDTPSFGAGVSIDGATWSGAASGNASGGGPFTLAAGATIGRDTTRTYDVSVRFHYTGASTPGSCASGAGLRNRGSLGSGEEAGSTADNVACVEPPAVPTTNLTLTKSVTAASPIDVNESGRTDAGDRIDFTFTLVNNSQVRLTSLAIQDPLVTGLACPATSLEPGASTVCTASRTLTQNDMDTGAVNNTASATGKDPFGRTVRSNDSSTSTPLPRLASLVLDKTASAATDRNGNGRIDAGDQITFGFTVTNTGVTTVTSVALNDSLLPGVSCSPTTLTPGASATCTATAYSITQADMDAGSVTNTATAVGKDPTGTTVTSNQDATSTTLLPAADLALVKRAGTPTDVNQSGITDAGDTIAYTFTLTNTGNVTVSGLDIVDPMLGSGNPVTCAATSLAPGASVTCVPDHVYVVTAADETAGSVHNSAFASGTDPGGDPVTSPPSTTRTPVTVPDPSLGLDKRVGTVADVNNDGLTNAGDTIDYVFTVTNLGNVPLTAVAVSDPLITGSICGATSLQPGASTTCTATYTVQANDVSAGAVTNVARAIGTDPDNDPVTSDPDTTSTPTEAVRGSLSLVKTAGEPTDVNGSGITDAGDTIVYSFTVTNAGNVTMSGLALFDAKLAAQSITTDCGPTSLAPGQSRTCTASAAYTITATDVTAGAVVNTAVVTGLTPGGPPVPSDPATTTTPTTTPAPKLALVKTAAAPVDANGSGITDAGDTIVYSFKVTNTGNVPVDAVRIVDLKLGVDSPTCTPASLAPGASVTCTAAPYTITGTDLLVGKVLNSATAHGRDPDNGPVTSNESHTETPTTTPVPTLSLAKAATAATDVNTNGITDAGDTIGYSFTVTNTGNVPLTSISVDDPKLTAAGITVACAPGSLAPGESRTCEASEPYVITAADVTAGVVRNTATATGQPPSGPPTTSDPSSTSTATTTPNPELELDKRASLPTDVNGSLITDAGDTIVFDFVVTNRGNVPVDSVTIIDPALSDAGLTIACSAAALAPDDSVTCTVSGAYTITAADVSAGAMTNTAVARGTSTGGTVESNPDTTSTPTTRPAGALRVVKNAGTPVDVNDSGITDAGDTIAYTFTVTNTGNVPLTGIAIADPMIDPIAVACPAGALAPGASVTCAAASPYVVTEADETAGEVVNTARVSGTDPDGDPVTSPPSTTTTAVETPRPALGVVKNAGTPVDVNDSGITDAGDTIAYTFTVTNTGNVPLTGIAIADPMIDPIAVACPAGALAPGASVTCAAASPYVVTEADETAGEVVNTARVSGTDPDGDPVTSPPSTTTTPVTAPTPHLLVEKAITEVADVNASGITDVGDTVRYSFTVTNTGNVPVHDVRIDDPTLAGASVAVTCPATTLAVGASVVCTSADYTVSTSDLSAGAVRNSATAVGKDPDSGPVVSPPDSTEIVTVTPAASLAVEKTAGLPADVNHSGITDAGDTIAYTFMVTNTGNVPVRDIAITDPLLDERSITIACATGVLAPGESRLCAASAPYVVRSADELAGAVTNTATATGLDPDDGPVTSPPDTTTTPVTLPQPALLLTKTAAAPVDVNGSGITDAGDTIAYTFTVTNTGNVPLRAASIVDPKLTAAGVSITCPATTLSPGATLTCSASEVYAITAADLAAGSATNVATATATDPDGDPVTSDPDRTSTPTTTPQPGLSVVKEAGTPVDVNASGLTDAGDTIAYTFTVTNTGNVTLRGLNIVDPKLFAQPQMAITCGAATLAAGEQTTCQTSAATPYVVTETDEQAGRVDNVARATTTGPDGDPVRSPESSTSTPVSTPQPAVVLDKSEVPGSWQDLNTNGIADAGDTLAYTFTVTNIGNVPLHQVSVDDPLLDAQAPVCIIAGPLAPGDDATCGAARIYTITAADVDAGAVTNTATATGQDPDGDPVTSPPDVTSHPTTKPSPGLLLDKTVIKPTGWDANSSGTLDAGDTLRYSFTVTNTGNVPVDVVDVADPKIDATGALITCTPNRLEPGDSVVCSSVDYTVTAGDVQAGSVANAARATGTSVGTGTPVTSPEDTTSTPTTLGQPRLNLVKAKTTQFGADGIPQAGETITYSFVVRNLGNVPIRQVTILDPMLSGVDGAGNLIPLGCQDNAATSQIETIDLPVLAIANCGSMVYELTQDDIDAGSVYNVAIASGKSPDGDPVDSPPSNVTVPLKDDPSLIAVKSVTTTTDTNASGLTDAGDIVHFQFTVTNTGNITLRDVSVVDDRLIDEGVQIACAPAAPAVLAPGQELVCTAESVVTAADVRAGAVVNTAVAVGETDTTPGVPVTSDETTTSTPTLTPQPGLTIAKSAGTPVDVNQSGLTDAGDTVVFTFVVTNSGNVPVRDVVIDDPRLAGLAITCTNSSVGSCADRLEVGETRTFVAEPATVTVADVVSGAMSNTAKARGTDPDNGPVTSPPDSAAVPTTEPQPGMILTKAASVPDDRNASGLTDAGDTVVYTFTVTNTGNVPLDDVTIDDPRLAGVDLTCQVNGANCTGPLGVGQVWTWVSDPYVIAAADVVAGTVANRATATGTDPDGHPVTTPPATTTTPTTMPQPALRIDKQLVPGSPVDGNASGLTDEGDELTYRFVVTNTGNVPITDLRVVDPHLRAVGIPIDCVVTRLAVAGVTPGTSETICTARSAYTVTAADEVNGSIENTATALGTDPDQAPVESGPDMTSVPTTVPQPALTLVKNVDGYVDANGSGQVDAGDELTYGFIVTNVGNVPISAITIADPVLGSTPITCLATTLTTSGPGASTTCTAAPFTITQAQQVAGSAANQATAAGEDPDGDPVVSPPASTSTPTTMPVPALMLDKTVALIDDRNASGLNDAGDQITYSFVVTNTGNVTLDTVAVQDSRLSSAPQCPVGPLASGDSVTCTAAPYEITAADVTAGAVVNIATATARSTTGGTVTSPQDTTTTPTTVPAPALTLVKTAATPVDVDGSGMTDVGDTVVFSFSVTNDGNVPLRDVVIDDPLLSAAGTAVACASACADPLAVGAERIYVSDPYTVTLADVVAAQVLNRASVVATDPDGGVLPPTDDSTSVPTTMVSALGLDKTVRTVTDVDRDSLVDTGDTITYDFVVTNLGNVAVRDVAIEDPMLKRAGSAATPIACPATSLDKGTSMTCSATYTLTEADVVAGSVNNTARASGVDPRAEIVTSPYDDTAVPTMPVRDVELVKEAELLDRDDDGMADVGEKIRYTFTVTNTGNLTLTGLAIDDPMLDKAGVAVRCPATTLAPGKEMVCVATYTVTKADVEAGPILNVATVHGDDVRGRPVTGVDSVSISSDPHGLREGELPDTGGPSRWLGWLSSLMIGAGAVLLAIEVRRRRKERTHG